MTHAELAKKFGWPSVIISILLLPFCLLWSRLLAFPVWLKSEPKYTVENIILYPNDEDLFRKDFYYSETSVTTFISGWNCHIDAKEGGKGKFFESFWGIINCLDIDDKGDTMIITRNSMSWLSLNEVFVEFAKTKVSCHGHRVRFFFPLDGPNMYNPFTWATMAFIMSGMTWFSKVSFKDFKRDRKDPSKVRVTATSKSFPAEPEGEKNQDGSIQFNISSVSPSDLGD